MTEKKSVKKVKKKKGPKKVKKKREQKKVEAAPMPVQNGKDVKPLRIFGDDIYCPSCDTGLDDVGVDDQGNGVVECVGCGCVVHYNKKTGEVNANYVGQTRPMPQTPIQNDDDSLVLRMARLIKDMKNNIDEHNWLGKVIKDQGVELEKLKSEYEGLIAKLMKGVG